ncbi:hypothetical protein [Phenylobacterium sp. SCN 70-31]|uniref:hypothetical protein n=1 Tax=Phenylobacterium sp. SCN 70-31 TaxID=1660129 RepID=UPI0025E92ECC|nr:hypothetical protein [Phenylobacterium sp. SCN 70-31]
MRYRNFLSGHPNGLINAKASFQPDVGLDVELVSEAVGVVDVRGRCHSPPIARVYCGEAPRKAGQASSIGCFEAPQFTKGPAQALGLAVEVYDQDHPDLSLALTECGDPTSADQTQSGARRAES